MPDPRFRAAGIRRPAETPVLIELVSADSLPKTGIFAETAGDFRGFSPHVRLSGRPETETNGEKPGFLLGSLAERRTAWLATQW